MAGIEPLPLFEPSIRVPPYRTRRPVIVLSRNVTSHSRVGLETTWRSSSACILLFSPKTLKISASTPFDLQTPLSRSLQSLPQTLDSPLSAFDPPFPTEIRKSARFAGNPRSKGLPRVKKMPQRVLLQNQSRKLRRNL